MSIPAKNTICLWYNGGPMFRSVSWQITPLALMQAIAHPDKAAAKRAFDAMMEMGKIDISAIEAAVRG